MRMCFIGREGGVGNGVRGGGDVSVMTRITSTSDSSVSLLSSVFLKNFFGLFSSSSLSNSSVFSSTSSSSVSSFRLSFDWHLFFCFLYFVVESGFKIFFGLISFVTMNVRVIFIFLFFYRTFWLLSVIFFSIQWFQSDFVWTCKSQYRFEP
jgi:hypothetical protein